MNLDDFLRHFDSAPRLTDYPEALLSEAVAKLTTTPPSADNREQQITNMAEILWALTETARQRGFALGSIFDKVMVLQSRAQPETYVRLPTK